MSYGAYRTNLIEGYRDWLYNIILLDDYVDRYEMLLDYLLGRRFTWFVDHDDNRAEDGYLLRQEFMVEFGLTDDDWYDELPDRCSVLEMMIALASRCEDVLYEPDAGDRTAIWFWNMVWNLGLEHMDDERFDELQCDICVNQLLDRVYKRDGEGGLFPCRDKKIDMRKAEIWYQMNVWIEENFEI